jgi:hypothetical protein
MPPEGGKLTINKPGDPLDGLTINVPSGSYTSSLKFTISYAPENGHTFGTDFNPITPMISVDNGGQYATEIMEVTIPVNIPSDSFAMGFIYDKSTRKLEGMPLLTQSATSITVGTRHFSDFIISMIPKFNLKKDIDTGFRPGIDDWAFPNEGSYIAPTGHCAGQALTALWYYCTQPDGKDLTLYGRYDNNGNQPATPGLWQDDSSGYRLASVIQADNWNNFALDFWHNLSKNISEEYTWYAFAYAMQLTSEPQFVFMLSSVGGSHAMIVYRIKDGNLYIADPNYPGNTERRILYTFGMFIPYNSGANAQEIAAGRGKDYETIKYGAKSTIVDFNHIAARWTEFKNQTIGNDRFPKYSIIYRDENGRYQELKDGTTLATGKIIIAADFNGIWKGINVYRDGQLLSWDADSAYELKPGNNQLGIWIRKDPGNGDLKYVDFKYINVTYNAKSSLLSISPNPATIEVGQTQVLTVTSSKPPAKPSYEWFLDTSPLNLGSMSVQGSTRNTYTFNYSQPGTYTFTVREWDEGASPRKLTGSSGSCTVVVQAKTVNKLALLQKYPGIQVSIRGNNTYNVWQAPNNISTPVSQGIFNIPQALMGDLSVMPITWSGASFSAKYTSGTGDNQDVYTISGSVSADGASLTSLSYSWTDKSKGTYQYSDRSVKIALSGPIPIWSPENFPVNTISGATVAQYITSISDVYNNYYTGGEKRDASQYVSSDWSNGLLSIKFVDKLDPFVTGSNGNFSAN